jgi:hypothetical protein
MCMLCWWPAVVVLTLEKRNNQCGIASISGATLPLDLASTSFFNPVKSLMLSVIYILRHVHHFLQQQQLLCFCSDTV